MISLGSLFRRLNAQRVPQPATWAYACNAMGHAEKRKAVETFLEELDEAGWGWAKDFIAANKPTEDYR
jgi:hypothetical protein